MTYKCSKIKKLSNAIIFIFGAKIEMFFFYFLKMNVARFARNVLKIETFFDWFSNTVIEFKASKIDLENYL